MRRRAFGLMRRFIRSVLKDRILENLKDNGTMQQTSGLYTQSNGFASSFMKSKLRNFGYGGEQKLVIPSSQLQVPTWSDSLNANAKDDDVSKRKDSATKVTGALPNLGIASRRFSGAPEGELSLKSCLMRGVQDKMAGANKVTVVGAGSVGVACAYTILAQKLTTQLCLVDPVKNKLEGEVLDMQHGSTFVSNLDVKASTEYEETADSTLCIITAGARQKPGESRLHLLDKNVSIMKSIVPPLVKYSPNAVLLVASNPVDVLTYVSWKLSGLPQGRVVGTGTNLDSSRFRYYIAQRLGIAPGSCHGWIIGEHGDSSVAVWSGVNVAGVRLADLNPSIGQPDDPENWADVHKQVIDSAGEVIKLKGYTSWAIGMSVAALSKAILHNLGSVHAVSVLVKGYHDIEDEAYLSLPASLGCNGVNEIVIQPLTEEEKGALHKSAHVLFTTQSEVKL